MEDLVIVLKSTRYEDRHQIVNGLSQAHGKISAIARNSIHSRRFGGCLDLFTASLWYFDQSKSLDADLYRLKETQIKRAFPGLTHHFEVLLIASFFNEVMLKLAPPNESCEFLFRLHANALDVLEQHAKDSKLTHLRVLNTYLVKVLNWSGHLPEMQFCLCRKTRLLDQIKSHPQQPIHGCIVEGGWRCSFCRQGGEDFLIPVLALADLVSARQMPIQQSPTQMNAALKDHQSLFQFLTLLLCFHVPGFDPKTLKSLPFLQEEAFKEEFQSNLRPQEDHFR